MEVGGIEIVSEDLVHINKGDSREKLGFVHKPKWRDSVVRGRRSSPYISTKIVNGQNTISLHSDSMGSSSGGRPRRVLASSLPRTMLSHPTSATEHRTVVLARQEISSWIQLQLEPSALRAPDPFTAPEYIAPDGAHLPATLRRLASGSDRGVYTRIANRLAELVEEVESLRVDDDWTRQLYNILLSDLQGSTHPASALSDGTLRFLALSVIEADPTPFGILCLEEPENGIHPIRIPAMVRLLQDIAVDPDEPVGMDNPLRQVIINTHSPSIVAEVPDDALVLARSARGWKNGSRTWNLEFVVLQDTWRTKKQSDMSCLSRGELAAYLNPIQTAERVLDSTRPRVKDRKDLQLLLPLCDPANEE